MLQPWSEQMQSELNSTAGHAQHPQPVAPALCPVISTQVSFQQSPSQPRPIIKATQVLLSSIEFEAPGAVPVVISSQPSLSFHLKQSPHSKHIVHSPQHTQLLGVLKSPQMSESVQFLQTLDAAHTQSPKHLKGNTVFPSPQLHQYQEWSQAFQPSWTKQDVLNPPEKPISFKPYEPELSVPLEPELLVPQESQQPEVNVPYQSKQVLQYQPGLPVPQKPNQLLLNEPQEPHHSDLSDLQEPQQSELPHPQKPHQSELPYPQEPQSSELLHPQEPDQSELPHPQETKQLELSHAFKPYQSELPHLQEPHQSEQPHPFEPHQSDLPHQSEIPLPDKPLISVLHNSQRPLLEEPHQPGPSLLPKKSHQKVMRSKVCSICDSHFNQSYPTIYPPFPVAITQTEHDNISYCAPSSSPQPSQNCLPKALHIVHTGHQAGLARKPSGVNYRLSSLHTRQKGNCNRKESGEFMQKRVQKSPTCIHAKSALSTHVAHTSKRQKTNLEEDSGATGGRLMAENVHKEMVGRGMEVAPKEGERVKAEMKTGYTGEGNDSRRPRRAAAIAADVKNLCLVLEEEESIVRKKRGRKKKSEWNEGMFKWKHSQVKSRNSDQHTVPSQCLSVFPVPSPECYAHQSVFPHNVGCNVHEKVLSSKHHSEVSFDYPCHHQHNTYLDTLPCNSASYCSVPLHSAVLPCATILPSQHCMHSSERSVFLTCDLSPYQIIPRSSKEDPDHPSFPHQSSYLNDNFPISPLLHSSFPSTLHSVQHILTSQNSSLQSAFATLTPPSHPTGIPYTLSSLQCTAMSYVSSPQSFPSLSNHLPSVSYVHSTPISSSFLPDGHLHQVRNLPVTSLYDTCGDKTQQKALQDEEKEWKRKEVKELLVDTDNQVWN